MGAVWSNSKEITTVFRNQDGGKYHLELYASGSTAVTNNEFLVDKFQLKM